MSKELFALVALAQIPKLLTLLDRHPHSPTYGCFDRNFWHYKITNFPNRSGQELVWPLALVYATDIPNNSFYQQPLLRDWVEAAIIYTAKSSNFFPLWDYYYPLQYGSTAAVFSLLACLESYQLLGLANKKVFQFFKNQGNWLVKLPKTHQLTNHQALIILCLERLGQVCQSPKWDREKTLRLERFLDLQNEQGWFPEAIGFEPGEQTLTISCLARLYEIRPDERLKEAIVKAVKLAIQFIYPDHSYSGESGNYNTYNFFPHGFELVGRWYPEALQINDAFLTLLANHQNLGYADDYISGHRLSNYLLAWQDFGSERPAKPQRERGQIWLKEAGILIDRRENLELYMGLKQGGVFQIFRNDQLIFTDTQFSVQVRRGRQIKNAIVDMSEQYEIKIVDDEIIIQGALSWENIPDLTLIKLEFFRSVISIIARFSPNLIYQLLPKMLMTGKKLAPFRFYRRLRWENNQWCCLDVLYARAWKNVVSVGISGEQKSIYVVTNHTFQSNQLQPWLDLTEEVKKLTPVQPLKLERYFKIEESPNK